MPEKLIVIDITDNENIILDGKSELKEIKGNGKLIVLGGIGPNTDCDKCKNEYDGKCPRCKGSGTV